MTSDYSVPISNTGSTAFLTWSTFQQTTITAAPARAPLGSVRKHGERVTVVAKTRAGVIVAVLRSVFADAARSLHVSVPAALRGASHKVNKRNSLVKRPAR